MEVKLNKLGMDPEKADLDVYEKLASRAVMVSEMLDTERRFLNGLLRLTKPENILEIGVSQGGSTAVILNAISDRKDTRLVSIDNSEYYYKDTTLKVGCIVDEIYPEGNDQWTLYAGKDPVEVLPEIDTEFDFCVIDTRHVHPVESMNFLTALPYLKEDAIVVLHDIGAYLVDLKNFPNLAFACKILFDSVTGKKLRPKEKYRRITNIGAFQVNRDTWEYIENVFYSLEFPWGLMPDSACMVEQFVREHYPNQCYRIFRNARIMNAIQLNNGNSFEIGNTLDEKDDHELANADKLIFVGGLFEAEHYLKQFDLCHMRKPDVIWDMNYNIIKDCCGIPVEALKMDSLSQDAKSFLVIVINEESLFFDKIVEELKNVGFKRYITEKELRKIVMNNMFRQVVE